MLLFMMLLGIWSGAWKLKSEIIKSNIRLKRGNFFPFIILIDSIILNIFYHSIILKFKFNIFSGYKYSRKYKDQYLY